MGKEARWFGDFGFAALVRVIVALLVIGARRLRHLEVVRNDPMVARFTGLSCLPTTRTLSRALKQMTVPHHVDLDELSRKAIVPTLRSLKLPRLTLDIDGSVITTGMKVERAERGYNPHQRKNPSYYPISATLAQTGHVWSQRNRPGSVHDSHDSDALVRHAVTDLREQLGHRGPIEIRADSAFFADHFLEACDEMRVEYAVKVPMWPWLNLRQLVAQRKRWHWVNRQAGVQGFYTTLHIPQWNRTERIAIFRTQRNHRPAKGLQLDLFNPDDGYWEHAVVASNKRLSLHALWRFQNGHGVHEKTLAELKSGYAYDCLPTNHFGANTAWQKLAVLSHNIVTSFQLETTAQPKPRTYKRTAAFLLRTIATLRFEWLNKAGRIVRPAGRAVLRLARNDALARTYQVLESAVRRL
jgi:hypothetical protein